MHFEQTGQEIVAGDGRLAVTLGRIDPLGDLCLGEFDEVGHALPG